ncbi:phosphoserine phosphatase SerB [Demequina sp. SYSU T00039]|uniref:phosphoserine phosphatase n=1 Tax=Demequina lignilytica TaxID=3051663 RepID=A0AAW7M9V5_9MICO|nr:MULTISPECIES: phosphoserine phosphatase SerB [unclassified Demequina]MDN4479066.1 phosphoserine phosphatase SerB [Demequina sp. SYSU T00039-1]MDN4489015.1 phosphoserine phosphatase SerB [Demequina sp. SYSU T00039]MDN4491274.1 phosphoserine phosphatase SerB [Demequina sp. SYSU T00068]
MRLCVLDVDSTLITAEVIELIAERAGTREEVARITERAMRGELDFSASLGERVATLAGVPDTVFGEVVAEVELTPGVETLIRSLQASGWEVALVSGGFTEVVSSLAARLGITRFRANRLEVADGRLTGRTIGPVIDREAKAQALRDYAAEVGCPLEDAVAIGDGANDLGMMDVAGLSIAWHAKPVVQAQADVALNGAGLDEALEVLGVPRVVAAS